MQGRLEDVNLIEGQALDTTVHIPEIGAPSSKEQYGRLYRMMAVTDILSIGVAMLLAYWLRFTLRIPAPDFLYLLLATPFAVVGIFALFRLYSVHQFTPAEEFRRIILAVSLGLTGLVTVSFWSKSSFSRAWIGLSWALALLGTLGSRRLWHGYVRRARTKGKYSFNTLIVGANEEALHLAELMRAPNFGFRALGFVATSQAPPSGNGIPILGNISALRKLIQETGAECVFVAATALGIQEMGHVAKAVRLEGVEVRVTATLPEVLSSRLSVQPIGGVMALSLRAVRLTGSQVVAKRAFDLVVAAGLLLLTLPLWTVVAVAIKLTSPGRVLYRQRRVGQRGKPFTMLKFRTMVNGADGMIEQLRERNEASGPLFKVRDDPRVTRVGRWLRRWSIDELPQLLNVVRGDMSLVGPRPPLADEVMQYEEWQFDRLEVRPGITGLWQVSGRSELSFDEYVRLDLFYIENWSLAYDLYIMAKTLPILLSRRGAY